jgi:Protein of unknown function (DUF3800)
MEYFLVDTDFDGGIMTFKLFCDDSHDSTREKRKPGTPPFQPKSYLVAGFFADDETWAHIEPRWRRKNELEGVARYHAAHLNAATYEYDGWKPSRRKTYNIEILRILKSRRHKIHGLSCGIYADDYRHTISADGQIRMGHPFLVCFKTLVATVAAQMEEGGFAPEDRFTVVMDRGDFDDDVVRVFYAMKDNPKFRHGHRLEDCVIGDAETYIGLQTADFVAYETFRLMHEKRKGQNEIRAALKNMLGTTGFFGYVLNEQTFMHMKDAIEADTSIPDGLVIVPPDFDAR